MSLPELLEYVKAGGGVLAPVFAYLWFTERSDRREVQGKLEHLSERTITVMTELKGLLTGKAQ